MADTTRHQIVVPDAMAGKRLDRVLAEMFPDYSRSRIRAWIEAGQVTLDERRPRPRSLVHGGERVELVATIEKEEGAVEPQSLPLDIVYEDDALIVIDKPPGMVTHPGAGNPRNTVQNALLGFDPTLATLPRGGLIHRLDKDTGGLLIVARSLPALTRLTRAMQARQIRREYRAICHGVLTAGGCVDRPIGRHPVDRTRMAVREGGRAAVTHYRVSERYRAHTLCRVTLETGRTHQIRVHFQHLGHPLVGDPVYGRRLSIPAGADAALGEVLRQFRRQALQASRLEFEHPLSAESLAFSTGVSADMSRLIDALRKDARSQGSGGK